jgi:ubiquinone/menaquinone biosynthesis C-methylase UbiE
MGSLSGCRLPANRTGEGDGWLFDHRGFAAVRGDASSIKTLVTDYFDRDARHYHVSHYGQDDDSTYTPLRYRQAYIEELIEARSLPKGAKILDVGCGPGELALNLSARGYDVWAVDIAPAMVDEATKLLEDNGYPSEGRVLIGDIEKLEFDDGFFDVVIASGVIEYQETDAQSLREMNRVLRPGGYMVLNVSNRYAYPGVLVVGYLWAKRHDATRSVLRLVKGKVLKRGDELSEYPDRRTHSPAAFDRELLEFGFRKVDHRYFHFSPVPVPLDALAPNVLKPVGKWMERFTDRPAGRWLGGGYIVIAQKE